MMNETTMTKEHTQTQEEFILDAAYAVHNAIKNDDGFLGYDASVEAFTNLHREVEAIVENFISADVDDVEKVVDAFFEVNTKIAEGELEPDWYCY